MTVQELVTNALRASSLQHKGGQNFARCGRQPKQEELVMAKSQWTKAEPKGLPLIEIVCLVLEEAAQKVIRNKGAAGVQTASLFEDLPRFLEKHGGENQSRN